jgi:hypothetical protein
MRRSPAQIATVGFLGSSLGFLLAANVHNQAWSPRESPPESLTFGAAWLSGVYEVSLRLYDRIGS